MVKQTGQGTALLYMSFNSDVLSAAQITDYITRVVQPRLQTIDGVASAQIIGGQNFAMRVWLDPDKMAARGVTASDIRNALAANNFTSAAGQIKSDFTQTSINALTSLETAQAFAQLTIFNKGDALVKLGDVARIELGPESVDSSAVFDGLKAVFIGVYATPTANPLTVIEDVRKAFPSIEAALPGGVKGAIAYDATEFIRASIDEVAKTLLEAAAIVIVVIFLFLGDLRATLIPIVTIPLSLVGVMGFMLLLGYSINLLTLLAFVLAIGLVVDDAIVVVENIYRHIEEGHTPKDAALLGAREIAAAGRRHDHHAGGGLCADRLRDRAVRRSVQGIRLHSGRLGGRLGLHRPHAVADDVLEAAAAARAPRPRRARGSPQPGRIARRSVRGPAPAL